MSINIGTSGWYYEHWNKVFYPEGLKANERLKFYSHEFSTVELNNTFYHVPKSEVIKNWRAIVPKDFVFSVKASQYITHRKRLHDVHESMDYFFSQIELLKEKLGPILFQLPPNFKMDLERLEEFLKILKKDYLYTFEFRNSTWFVPEVYEILQKYNTALCITDLGGNLSPQELTANFVYMRLHGPQKAYTGSYGTKNLKEWQKKIVNFQKNSIATYCYFDNDEGVCSPRRLRIKDFVKKTT